MRTLRPATTRLLPYARLPRRYKGRRIVTSTVDVWGRAHWLLAPADNDPPMAHHESLVVTVADGTARETHLATPSRRSARLDALPHGGFVLADARCAPGEENAQVFDALGRRAGSFPVGDGIEHLLADEAGDVWVGYFDEGIYGDDPLSAAGLRRFSSTGEPVWEYEGGAGREWISACYALNVHDRTAWTCPYTGFALFDVRNDALGAPRPAPVHGARGVAVHGDRVAFFGGYLGAADNLLLCTLDPEAVEPLRETRLIHQDGGPLGRRRVVCRGARLYVQAGRGGQWGVVDLAR
ncbi:hypothetical protein ACIO3O_27275 [Streptomyces sp. NPDC087440]|uniref:hypothetical protein n=1 Tax=Streptomyces sp. NPDC087440 TaxID=3365790 RepID=UPI0038200FDA